MKRRLIGSVLLLSLFFASIPIASSYGRAIYHPRKIHSPAPKNTKWPTMKVKATAYVVRKDRGCQTFYTAHTANGSVPRRGTVAVDTRILPFGTRFYIPRYGYGIAQDTGGAIIGRHIDLAFLSCKSAFNWGSRYLTIHYLLPKKNNV
jgi:3D (Asp-Asp-Asp) domain-containing protein